ncbi:mpv17-like protein 2 [Bacillus rossius redtenbacheri]|uniref:mpv17-like protein 2 n=1 Tax=Bacillus rossius redtenbacheri TaxID=93214 RepID=UPI002FDF06B2
MILFSSLFSRPANYAVTTKGPIRRTLNKVFGKYLLLTNTVTSGILMAVGDLVQQKIEMHRKFEKKSVFDWNRTGRMFVVGLVSGPPQHLFYKVLDRLVPQQHLYAVTKKVLWDQFVASPMCILIFFFGLGYLEGHNYGEITAEVKEKFLTVYLADWLVWVPAQYVNFYFLAPKFRVAYVNFITMLYNVFLSYVKHDM